MDGEAKSGAGQWTCLNYVPLGLVILWWLWDLQFQWRSRDEFQSGWIVWVLAAYLVWERWVAGTPDDKPLPLRFCSIFAILGAPFVLIAELYKQAIAPCPAASFALSIGSLFFITANVLCLHGAKALRHFAFPLIFVCLAIPLPALIWNPVVTGLQRVVTVVDMELLNALGVPALQQGNVIRLPRGIVGVNEACSGVRSLQSSVMAGLFVGHLMFGTVASRLLFTGVGVVLALLGNLIRSLLLASVAHVYGGESLTTFHDSAGWGVFLFTVAGLVGAGRVMLRIDRRSAMAAGRRDQARSMT